MARPSSHRPARFSSCFFSLVSALVTVSSLVPSPLRAAEIFTLIQTYPLDFGDLYSTGRQAALGYAELASTEGMGGLWSNPGAPLASGATVESGVAIAGDLPNRADVDVRAVGGSVTWSHIRIALAARGYSYDQEAFTVAPGPPPTIEFSRREVAAGAAIDLGHFLGVDDRLGLSVGAAWRHRAEEFGGTEDDDSEVTTTPVDFGASGTWRDRLGSMNGGIAVSAVLLNAFGADFELGARQLEHVRGLRLGTTVSLEFDPDEGGRVPLAGHLATAMTRQFGDVDRTVWHVGIEVVLASHVFLRGGHEDLTSASTWSYGAGLRYALRRGLTPLDEVAVALEWTRQDFDLSLAERSIDTWGARLGVAF